MWKKLAEVEIKKVAVSAETSTWTEKHAEGSELVAPPPHKRADESGVPGFVRCEKKCGENVHPNGYRVHLRACQGTENKGRAKRKNVQCERCNGWFSRILRHAPNCVGPGARGRGRSNRGEIQIPNQAVREDETNSTRRRLRGKEKNPEELMRRSQDQETARVESKQRIPEELMRSNQDQETARVESRQRIPEELTRGKPGPRGSTNGKQAENSRGDDDERPGS